MIDPSTPALYIVLGLETVNKVLPELKILEMKVRLSRFRPLCLLVGLCIVTATASCTEYWWSRGQAPGVETLLRRAQNELKEAMANDPYKRPEIAALARELAGALVAAHDSVKSNEPQAADKLAAVVARFAALEGKLSVTSRAPYAELFGQARALRDNAAARRLEEGAVGLLAARTIFFLASEMSVPAPSFGA